MLKCKGCGIQDVDGRKTSYCEVCVGKMKLKETKTQDIRDHDWQYVDLVMKPFLTDDNKVQTAELIMRLRDYNAQQLIQMATAFELMTRLHTAGYDKSLEHAVKDDHLYLSEIHYQMLNFVDEIMHHLRDAQYLSIPALKKEVKK